MLGYGDSDFVDPGSDRLVDATEALAVLERLASSLLAVVGERASR